MAQTGQNSVFVKLKFRLPSRFLQIRSRNSDLSTMRRQIFQTRKTTGKCFKCASSPSPRTETKMLQTSDSTNSQDRIRNSQSGWDVRLHPERSTAWISP